jgi:hypothetical protein
MHLPLLDQHPFMVVVVFMTQWPSMSLNAGKSLSLPMVSEISKISDLEGISTPRTDEHLFASGNMNVIKGFIPLMVLISTSSNFSHIF